MPPQHLRKLRLLLEDTPGNYAIIVFAQTELLAKLALAVNDDLRSRISYSALLKPLLPEDLYDELKHIRNALPNLEALLRNPPPQKTTNVVEPLARAHHVLHVQYRRKKQPAPQQLELF